METEDTEVDEINPKEGLNNSRSANTVSTLSDPKGKVASKVVNLWSGVRASVQPDIRHAHVISLVLRDFFAVQNICYCG